MKQLNKKQDTEEKLGVVTGSRAAWEDIKLQKLYTPNCNKGGDAFVTDPVNCAGEAAQCFVFTHWAPTTEIQGLETPPFTDCPEHVQQSEWTREELDEAIQPLRSNKAPGPDGLPQTTAEARTRLLQIYNSLWGQLTLLQSLNEVWQLPNTTRERPPSYSNYR